MELVGIIAVLRHRWVLVCLGALASLACGLLAAYRVSVAPPQVQSRATESGIATVQVLVDTPRPLLAAARTTGDDTIATRAALLGSLLATDPVRHEIARGAGVETSKLGINEPYPGVPVATPLSQSAVERSGPPEPNVLTVAPTDPRIPIVSITAQTRDPALAEPLAKSATAALESLVSGTDARGGSAVAIKPLGPVQSQRITVEAGRLKAAIAAIVAFALWCVALIYRFTRRSRTGRTDAIHLRLPTRPRGAPAHVQHRNGHTRHGDA